MSVHSHARVAAATAALSVALALAMTGTALAAAPSTLPTSRPATSGFAIGADTGPVPTTPAVPLAAP